MGADSAAALSESLCSSSGPEWEPSNLEDEPQQGMDAESSERDPGIVTKDYLRMLGRGKLASPEKTQRQVGRGIPQAAPSVEEAEQSVFQPTLRRLQESAEQDVTPLEQLSAERKTTSATWQRQEQNTKEHDVGSTHDQGEGTKTGTSKQATNRNLSATARSTSAPSMRPIAAGLPPSTIFAKVYTPGPGKYSPQVDRHGCWSGAACGFGTAPQRPHHPCVGRELGRIVSPGPVYLPSTAPQSTQAAAPAYRFGKEAVGARQQLVAQVPQNHPQWNPGPGKYDVPPAGAAAVSGAAAPTTVFGSEAKLMSPHPVLVSKVHALKEMQGYYSSPGPAKYVVARHPGAPSAISFTLGARREGYFDTFLDPRKQTSPGPAYSTDVDRRGSRTWGNKERATFSNAPRDFAPETNLSATMFLTKEHLRINQGVYSPGPIYAPARKDHVPTARIASGQPDRFFRGLAEPGRLA